MKRSASKDEARAIELKLAMPSDARADEAAPATPVPEASVTPPAGSPLFINRELSWLEFNQRVLDEARDPSVPLVERLKFLAIAAANLEEFFMVRVAGLIGQRQDHVAEVPADGMTPKEQLAAIAARTQRMASDIAAALRLEILPALETEGVCLVQPSRLTKSERAYLRQHFREQVMPVLTPLAIDPGHPFPHVRNKSLNLVAMLSGTHQRTTSVPAFAVVQVPSVLPRLVRIPSSEDSGCNAVFTLLDAVIAEHIGELFPGFRCLGAWPFRVVRNWDLAFEEDEAEDLLESITEEVRRRDRGNAVRLTVDATCAPGALALLQNSLNVDPQFLFPVNGPLAVPDLVALAEPLSDRRDLRDEPLVPQRLPPLRGEEDLFEAIAREDILLHHPYESFDPVVEFIATAAVDPQVLALKQTLYRTSGDSPVVTALMRAAEHGKQVTALVELKARFDEENNIAWARMLENAGVHVVYGLVGLKTHCKVSLVVRREAGKLRRYVHFGTGNYNPNTARVYTDVSLFTAKPAFGEDATSLFNLLTSCTAPPTWQKLVVAPLGLHERILALIEREAAFAREGKPARIVAKMNSLVDPDVIHALYRASQAGVTIDLIVRGICCLRPGLPGVSENIRVRSIVDRFLEHSRIFLFEAGGAREIYASSADWMPRNFVRRIEVLVPVEAENLKTRLTEEILGACLDDNVKATQLRPDGTYERVVVPSGGPPSRCQVRLLDSARKVAEEADARALRDRPFVVRPIRTHPASTESLPSESREREPSTNPLAR